MAFLDKEKSRTEKRRRNINSSGIYDMINVILGALIIVVAIAIFINKVKYDYLFSVEFLLVAAMNICMGIKNYKRQEIVKMIASGVAAAFFMAMTVISFIALVGSV